MDKAAESLRGLECSHAVLRQTTYPHTIVGPGPVVAAFTRCGGGRCKGFGRACDDFCHGDLAVTERFDELTACSPQRPAPSW